MSAYLMYEAEPAYCEKPECKPAWLERYISRKNVYSAMSGKAKKGHQSFLATDSLKSSSEKLQVISSTTSCESSLCAPDRNCSNPHVARTPGVVFGETMHSKVTSHFCNFCTSSCARQQMPFQMCGDTSSFNYAQLLHIVSTLQQENHLLHRQLFESRGKLQLEADRYEKEKFQMHEDIIKCKEQFEEKLKEIAFLKEKLRSTSSYLSNLPTTSEVSDMKKSLTKETEASKLLKTKLKNIEGELCQIKTDTLSKDLYILSLERKNAELKDQSQSTATELAKIREKFNTIQSTTEEEEKLQHKAGFEELERLKVECKQMKKLMKTKQQQYKKFEEYNEKIIQEYENRLAREKDSVEALQLEISHKDKQLVNLKTMLQGVSTAKQDMLEANLILQEKVQENISNSEDQMKENGLMIQLINKISSCVLRLERLVKIYSQYSQGKDFNLSLLLETPESLESCYSARSSGSLKDTLTTVQELSRKIERIRSDFTEKYAEEMGNRLNCITQ